MVSNTDYRLNRHHKFQRAGRKYVADLETHNIIEVDDVEWDILDRCPTQTPHQIVEALKENTKPTSVFDGIDRLQGLGKRGQLLLGSLKLCVNLRIHSQLTVNLNYWSLLILHKRNPHTITLQI